MDCLRQMAARDARWIDLRREVLTAYEARIRRELAGTAWAATGKSWYKTADGTITNNWPGTTIRYWWETRHADLRAYHVVPRAAAGETAEGAGGETPATRRGSAAA